MEKKPTARPSKSRELRFDACGVVRGSGVRSGGKETGKEDDGDDGDGDEDDEGEGQKEELFFMRIGTIKFRQRWIQREVSQSLTYSVALALFGGGVLTGVLVSRLLPLAFRLVCESGVG